VGKLQVGDIADFIIVSNLTDFDVEANYIKGELVAENGVSKIEIAETTLPNNFNCYAKNENDFVLNLNSQNIKVIEAQDGQLITTSLNRYSKSSAVFESDFENDFLQIAVINRYNNAQVANAIIKGFGLKKGAIASTVAHDSHNIICVGTNHNAMCKAVNALVESKGGISVYDETELDILALPIAGLISEHNAEHVANQWRSWLAGATACGWLCI
jgi:adenine deaminase